MPARDNISRILGLDHINHAGWSDNNEYFYVLVGVESNISLSVTAEGSYYIWVRVLFGIEIDKPVYYR